MNRNLSDLIEDYQRKRWFPGKYPDPYGELIDYLSVESLTNLVEEWQKTGSEATLWTAFYLLRLLPPIIFRDLHNDLRRAADDPLNVGILPHSAFYYIRSLPPPQTIDIWDRLKGWAERWESTLFDWLIAEIRLENSFPEIIQKLIPPQSSTLDTALAGTRELFSWKLQRFAPGTSLHEIFHAFRFRNRDGIADWNDFPALARTVLANSHFKKSASLHRNDNDAAAQFLFPITPPERVVQEYGKAAGPVDTMRFLFEFGKGLFYTGMNPALPLEQRIAGDPTVVYFWGAIYAQLLTDRASLQRLISPSAEDLAEELKLVLEVWYRSDSFLTIYRERAYSSFDQLRNAYAVAFEAALTVPAPDYLYLYELLRSSESSFRTRAMRHALIAVERFRELYGRHWFANPRYSGRIREYWWNGFTLTSGQILSDLGVSDSGSYPFTPR